MKKANVFVIEDGVKTMKMMTQLKRDELIDFDNNDLVENVANNILSSHKNILETIQRGDIVQFEKVCYRNDFKLIWDGNKLINLEFDVGIDEYGYVPRQFNMDEFPLNYWDDCIAHNYIRWPTKNITDQIRNNVILSDNHLGWNSFFIMNGVCKYTVIPECYSDLYWENITKDDYWIDSQDHISGIENQVIFSFLKKY